MLLRYVCAIIYNTGFAYFITIGFQYFGNTSAQKIVS